MSIVLLIFPDRSLCDWIQMFKFLAIKIMLRLIVYHYSPKTQKRKEKGNECLFPWYVYKCIANRMCKI